MSLFEGKHKVATLTIKELIEHRLGGNQTKPRLWLPPIQRSMVWTNAQIINYWDSLLRGYPPGLMMVHRVGGSAGEAGKVGGDKEGNIHKVAPNDLQLFDGQQRMATILLGLGEGQLSKTHKLWVDVGQGPKQHADTRFQLRISTVGQPFGYARDYPNNKFRLEDRRKAWEKAKDKATAAQLFDDLQRANPLIEGACPVLLQKVWGDFVAGGKSGVIAALIQLPGAHETHIEKFADAFAKTLSTPVILQLVGQEVVSNEASYVRFFSRLGQGGTRLSDDELTYSMIKARYPEIREKMHDIMQDREAGKLASEVELVLASLRVAKLFKPWADASHWQKVVRPNPNLVSKLEKQTEEEFKRLLGLESEDFGLGQLLKELRKALQISDCNEKGFPTMLLARLPHQLLDVLILFAASRPQDDLWPGVGDRRNELIAFSLYWLLFVAKPDKAADMVYEEFLETTTRNLGRDFFREIIQKFEHAGLSYSIPTREEYELIKDEAQRPPASGLLLRPWADRFTGAAAMLKKRKSDDGDLDIERKPGEALRVISTNRHLGSRALMWLQRDYLRKRYPNFDPTSGRDEDLPVDLDHLIPQKRFRFHWMSWKSHIDEKVTASNYWNHRDTIGHSLGNFRWLDARENRKRHDNEIEKEDIEKGAEKCHLIRNVDPWNELIRGQSEKPWSPEDVMQLQSLIDQRTLELCERILDEGGIWKAVGEKE